LLPIAVVKFSSAEGLIEDLHSHTLDLKQEVNINVAKNNATNKKVSLFIMMFFNDIKGYYYKYKIIKIFSLT
jgi:hypothetical protein